MSGWSRAGVSTPPARPSTTTGDRTVSAPRTSSQGGSNASGPEARAAGFTLIELLGLLALLGVAALLVAPPLARQAARLRVTLAAHEVAALLRQTRMRAVRANTHVAVRFSRAEKRRGAIEWALYADGDGDGVRTRDIRRGIDPLLDGPRVLRRFDTAVQPGFPEGRPPRDPGNPRRRLGRPKDPLRFGRSDIVSFGPLGTATTGTLYLTDQVRWTAAVRVYGTTGRVRVLIYDRETEAWR